MVNIQLNKPEKSQKKQKKTDIQPLGPKKSYGAIVLLALVGFLIQSFIQNGVFDWMPFVYILYPVGMVLLH